MTDGHALFRRKAPEIMARLMAEPHEGWALAPEDAAAILGNIGHECDGFRHMQEVAPAVRGSRGGYGWAQWTGPRRRAFEAWCRRRSLAPDGDEANYSFLIRELLTTEARAIPALKRAAGLRAKVIAFEAAYERAGIKHYDSREAYARIALEAWRAAPEPVTPVPSVRRPGLLSRILAAFARVATKG